MTIYEDALHHSWRHFAHYASQRMQAFNYSLAAAGFLTAGYAASLNADQLGLAAVIAFVGTCATALFVRLDRRNEQLVGVAECALRVLEQQMATETGISEMKILEATDAETRLLRTHESIMPALQLLICAAFIVMFGIAIYNAVN